MTRRRSTLPAVVTLMLVFAEGAKPADVLIGTFRHEAVEGVSAFVCPCDFDLGTDVDGENGLTVDHNGEGQHAYVNVAGKFLRLRNSEPFRFSCTPGSLVRARWQAADTLLKVDLLTEGPGNEACFFHGLMTLTIGARSATRKIVGGCGC